MWVYGWRLFVNPKKQKEMDRKKIFSWMAALLLPLCGLQAEDTHWKCDIHAFRYDMTAYVALQLHGANGAAVAEDYEVAAFSGDECRGVATVEEIPGTENAYYYLRIRSNTPGEETISFKYFNRKTGAEIAVRQTVDFEAQAQIGWPGNPYVLEQQWYTVGTGAPEGGHVEGGGTYGEGNEVTLTAVADEGYHFVEWADGTKDNPYSFLASDDVDCIPVFAPNVYKLICMVDGEEWQVLEVEYGAEVTVPDGPEKEGHTFNGWENAPSTMPARDVTVTGLYAVNKYKLIYLVDGEVYHEVEIEYGREVVPIDAPKKEGYEFMGWDEVPKTMPAYDVEVRGTFKATGVESVRLGNRSVDVYGLNGMKLKGNMPVGRIKEELKTGIYIIDGRKSVIK